MQIRTFMQSIFWEGVKSMGESEKRIITVLLTRYYSTFANFIYYISGRGYTHASLSLDDKNEYFYSFNFKGFRKEYPKKHKRRSGKSISYKLEVPQEGFEKIEQRIEEMEKEKDHLYYSRIGVVLCLLHIPCKRKNHYFCSQFVVEMLQLSNAVFIEKHTSLYLPNQLPFELRRQDCLREIVYNPI